MWWTPSFAALPFSEKRKWREKKKKKEGKWDSGECACDPIGHQWNKCPPVLLYSTPLKDLGTFR